MTTPELAAYLAAAILAALVLFQVALVFGAPLGYLAWGGANRVLPVGFRLASVVGIALYAGVALILLDRAGVVDVVADNVARTGTWIVVGLFALGAVMNLASRSAPERLVMTPVALALATLAFIVARG